MPLVKYTDPETAHYLAIKAAKYGFVPKNNFEESTALVSFNQLHFLAYDVYDINCEW